MSAPSTATPWSPPAANASASAPPRESHWAKALPFIGPVVLFIVWDLAVRLGFIKAILLPLPGDTLVTLLSGLWGGSLLTDFAVTVWRTLQAFVIAAIVGMPLGVLLGSNERAYRSVEFLIDFFRSTPSSALIKKNPEAAKKFIAAYGQGVAFVRSKPAEARQFLKGYTAIEGPLTGEVPLAAYTMYNEFTPGDIAYFQKFFDLFSDKGIFSSRLMVDTMLYKG